MSIETVITGMKNIVADDNATNVESNIRNYLFERAQDGTIYDYWLNTNNGKLDAAIKINGAADFLHIPLKESSTA